MRNLIGDKPPPTSVPIDRPTVPALLEQMTDFDTLSQHGKFMVVTVAYGGVTKKVSVSDEAFDIPDNAEVTVRLQSDLRPKTPAMRLFIDGKPSPAALKFVEAVRRVDAAYRSDSPWRATELIEDVRYVLRNDVPEAEKAFAEKVSLLTAKALVTVPVALQSAKFVKRVLDQIEPSLNELLEELIAFHFQVVDTAYVNRALSGQLAREGKPFDAKRVFRRHRAERGDDDALRNAGMKIAIGVINGIHHGISRYQGTAWVDHLESILEEGVHRGMRAHGSFDVGALESNGTVAMLRTIGRASRRAFRSGRMTQRERRSLPAVRPPVSRPLAFRA